MLKLDGSPSNIAMNSVLLVLLLMKNYRNTIKQNTIHIPLNIHFCFNILKILVSQMQEFYTVVYYYVQYDHLELK